ncbi:MAG: hypothetical protein R2703_13370 [Micropruina glycogenica]
MPTPAMSHGCTWHRLTVHDLPEIQNLIAAEEYLGDATHHHDLSALTVALADDPEAVSGNGVVLRKPSGTLIAYGWLQTPAPGESGGQVYLHGGCHPAWRHEGVQPTLLDWESERAIEWYLEQNDDTTAPLQLVVVTSSNNHLMAELLPSKGFPPQRWYHAMRRPLDSILPGELPGITLVPFDAAWSEPVRLLYNQTLSLPSDELDADAWAWGLKAAGIRDDLSWVALDGSQPVGWVLNGVMDLAGETSGWTEYLGAQPQWRNRGMFKALLARSHESFRTAGLSQAGIGVETDSDQGARPYLALGYQPVDTMVWYVNHVSLGTILSAQADEADGA